MRTRKAVINKFGLASDLPLQWGRVDEDTEGMATRRLNEPLIKLQWGRVDEDTEGRAPAPKAPDCFRLQWGRVDKDTEGSQEGLQMSVTNRASMGPCR